MAITQSGAGFYASDGTYFTDAVTAQEHEDKIASTPNDPGAVQFGNYDQAQVGYTVDPSTANPGLFAQQARTDANRRALITNARAKNSNYIPGETGDEAALRLAQNGYGVFTTPTPGQNTAQFRDANRLAYDTGAPAIPTAQVASNVTLPSATPRGATPAPAPYAPGRTNPTVANSATSVGSPQYTGDQGISFEDALSTLGTKAPTGKSDYDRYLKPAEDVFRSELSKLSQSDPFGNQAFLQKATDRGVAQARAVAAGARGGPGAVGGALRQGQGVQSQLAAQGAQEMAQLKAQDSRQAQAGRLAAAQGLGGLAQTGAQATLQEAENETRAFSAGFQALLGVEGLNQNDRQFLAELNYKYDAMSQDAKLKTLEIAREYASIDQQRYATDMAYKASVDDNIMKKYGTDKQLEGVLAAIKANKKGGTILGGLLKAGGVALATAFGGPAGGAAASGVASQVTI